MSDVIAVVLGSTIAFSFVLVAVQAVPYRHNPGMKAFIALSVLLTLVPIPVAAVWLGSFADADLVRTALFPCYILVEICWFVFVLEYSGRGPAMTRGWITFLLGYGVVTSLGVILFPLFEGVVVGLLLFLNGLLQMTLFAAVGYATFVVVRTVVQYEDLPRTDAIVLLTAGVGIVSLVLIQVLTSEIPAESMQGPQLAILGTMGATIAVAQARYGAFESGPSAGHLARETIFDEMSSAAFITDTERRIVDCNESAVDLFGRKRDQMLGTPVWEFLDDWTETTDESPVTLDTMVGQRQFQVDETRLTTSQGSPVGKAYLLEDVTDRQTHEQRLDVLNRILRHNLRNDLDAIQAFAEAIEHGDEDTQHLATRMHQTATELTDLGETVRQAERLLAHDESDRVRFDLTAVVAGLRDDFAERFPQATVQIDTTADQIVIESDKQLVEAAVAEVVQNGLEHNDAGQPHVTVVLEKGSDGIRVEVSDNGPGIPDRERAVLLDGNETPLRHGSGIGLWFVHWAMVELGGTLTLRENTPRGTVVSLTLPRPEMTGGADN